MNSRLRVLSTLAIAGACALATSATAVAATTHSTLRVEGPSGALDAGTNYSNTSITTRNTNACGPRDSRRERFRGAKAIGLVGHAARVNDRLNPFRTSDTFEFGTVICTLGGANGFQNAAWLYKVNHEFAPVGGDLLDVGRDDDVLWYFSNFSTGQNTGSELGLTGVPDRVRPNAPFQVRAVSYNDRGRQTSAAGVTLSGAGFTATGPTNADGRTTVVANTSGVIRLRGERGSDIPTAPEPVCVNAKLSQCPARFGETFIGTGTVDRIRGTSGADTIRARDGADRVGGGRGEDWIIVRGGGRDDVNCGRDRDLVIADRRDETNANCEQVNR